MKKKTIVFLCLALLFLIAVPECFSSSLLTGVICIGLCALFAFLAYRSFRMSKPDAAAGKRTAIIGAACGVAVLSIAALSKSSEESESDSLAMLESISSIPDELFSSEAISEQTESSVFDLPETSEQIENPSADFPETLEQTENSSVDFPETLEQTESRSANLPETLEQAESPVSSLPETQNNIQPASGNENNFNAHNNPEQQNTTASYVLNTGTNRFHYPHCSSVVTIAADNYAESNSSRDELIIQGYSPCGRCKP